MSKKLLPPNKRAELIELAEALIAENEILLAMLKIRSTKEILADFKKNSAEIDQILSSIEEIDMKISHLSENIYLS